MAEVYQCLVDLHIVYIYYVSSSACSVVREA